MGFLKKNNIKSGLIFLGLTSVLIFLGFEIKYQKKIYKKLKELVEVEHFYLENFDKPKNFTGFPCSDYLPPELLNVPIHEQKKYILEVKKIYIKECPEAYNASLIKDNNGKYQLFYRYDVIEEYPPKNPLIPFSTFIGKAELDKDFNQISPNKCLTDKFSKTSEDPRAFLYCNDIYVTFNDLLPNRVYSRGIKLAKFDEKSKKLEQPMHLKFQLGPIEKNWVPFIHSNAKNELEINFIYRINSQVILSTNEKANYLKINNEVGEKADQNLEMVQLFWPKKYGEPRGGTPAIKINNEEFLTFFHSSFKDEITQSIWYVMGAYTFKKDPPYQVTSYTKDPILFKGIYDTPIKHTACGLKKVIFPAGLILDKKGGREILHVSCGENDCGIKIVTMDKKLFLNSLTRIKKNKLSDYLIASERID